MITFYKIIQKFIITIFFSLFMFVQASLAGNTSFTDYPIGDLKVVEVDSHAGTALLRSPEGQTSFFTLGDMVGQEDFKIIGINDSSIELEGYPDASGRKRKGVIPVVPIVIIDDSYLIPARNIKKSVDEMPGLP